MVEVGTKGVFEISLSQKLGIVDRSTLLKEMIMTIMNDCEKIDVRIMSPFCVIVFFSVLHIGIL